MAADTAVLKGAEADIAAPSFVAVAKQAAATSGLFFFVFVVEGPNADLLPRLAQIQGFLRAAANRHDRGKMKREILDHGKTTGTARRQAGEIDALRIDLRMLFHLVNNQFGQGLLRRSRIGLAVINDFRHVFWVAEISPAPVWIAVVQARRQEKTRSLFLIVRINKNEALRMPQLHPFMIGILVAKSVQENHKRNFFALHQIFGLKKPVTEIALSAGERIFFHLRH